jgi:diadenosine tetraphosphate (Ap4A) HIT family hydrolase
MAIAHCPLCHPQNENVLWQNEELRVIDAGDANYPGFTRVIWAAHAREMTDLSADQRERLMAVVWQVEQVQRTVLQPLKINLAQFGNMVPHIHWHCIPRWQNDPHFPDAVWAPPAVRLPEQQAAWSARKHTLEERLPQYYQQLRHALATL